MSPSSSPSSWPLRRAVSAGGVVVRSTDDGPQVALIRTRSLKGETVWGLPKGTVEAGEDPAATALREVREETGLEAQIVEPLDPITYWFAWPPEQVRYRKTVHLFLMRMTGGDISRHDEEVEEVGFFGFDDAVEAATYPSERKALAGVRETVRTW